MTNFMLGNHCTLWIKEKKWHHNDINRYRNNKFYNAIKKYGWASFRWHIEYSRVPEEKLNELETETITKYNSYKNGYNSTLSDDNSPMHLPEVAKKVSELLRGKNNPMYGKKHTKEARAKMSALRKGKRFLDKHKQKLSKANKGKKLSSETRDKLSIAHTGKKPSEETKLKISKNNGKPMLGRHHSKESKEKMSVAHTGKTISKKSIEKKIATMKERNKFTVFKSGVLVGEWGSQKECAEDLGLISQSINMCLSQRRKSHRGYTFQRIIV